MGRTVGVEEEFLVLHAGAAVPRPVGEAVVDDASAGSDGQFEHELMQEQVELGTQPHTDVAALRAELVRRRAELSEAARERGARLAALATCPLPAVPHLTPDDRYERMREVFGEVASAQLSCGMHVHVSLDPADDGTAVLRRIRPWLPVFVALTASSPFWAGRDTGYASYRTILWGQWPTAGTIPDVSSSTDYDRLVADLVTSGAALDDGMVYFDARLSRRYPTVELRVCDVTPYADDAATVAALFRALVSTVAAAAPEPLWDRLIQERLLAAGSWRAARWGMTGELLDLRDDPHLVPAWDLVDGVVDLVGAALDESGDTDLVHDGLARVRRRGTGAELQRQVLERTGTFGAVVDAVCQETVSG